MGENTVLQRICDGEKDHSAMEIIDQGWVGRVDVLRLI